MHILSETKAIPDSFQQCDTSNHVRGKLTLAGSNGEIGGTVKPLEGLKIKAGTKGRDTRRPWDQRPLSGNEDLG